MPSAHTLEVRDGLDPVARQLLSSLGDDYVKSERVARAPMSYARLVSLVQPFRMRYPLVEGRGNFGSILDDPPAESKYTEARLAPIARELPRFPNLLVNGSRGIPPHNLSEAIAAVVAYIDDPDIDTAGLMEHVPGPDFPTGGIVLDGAGLRETYQRGRGSLRIRARTHFEDDVIVITELPYTIRLGENGVLREVVRYMREDGLPGIEDFSDASDREGMRILIGPSAGTDPHELLTQLFARTSLEIRLAVDMMALVDGEPRRLSLRDLISGFLADRDRAAVRRELVEISTRHRDSRRTSMR